VVAPRLLARAPAREALIDIQFEPRVPIEIVREFEQRVGVSFERSTPIWEAMFELKFSKEEGTQQGGGKQSAVGVRLESSSPPHVLQCRTNGFTFSRLSPYGRWEDLREATRKVWAEFIALAPAFVVTRIAVRYINEIKLPLPIRDFSDYLTCPPEVPPTLPQAISAFLQRVVIPDQEHDCTSIITQALEDQAIIDEKGTFVVVLLDIDVFRMTQIESNNIEAVWSSLDTLRNQKNRMFFEHLTETTVEMFQ
jgi:uncharacterized protein (TIGR04255 family)